MNGSRPSLRYNRSSNKEWLPLDVRAACRYLRAR
jgi:hypothetical protein